MIGMEGVECCSYVSYVFDCFNDRISSYIEKIAFLMKRSLLFHQNTGLKKKTSCNFLISLCFFYFFEDLRSLSESSKLKLTSNVYFPNLSNPFINSD